MTKLTISKKLEISGVGDVAGHSSHLTRFCPPGPSMSPRDAILTDAQTSTLYRSLGTRGFRRQDVGIVLWGSFGPPCTENR